MIGNIFRVTRSGCAERVFVFPIRTAELIDNLQGGLKMLLKRRLSPPRALVGVRKGAWREEKAVSTKTAEHRTVQGLSPTDLTQQINRNR